MTTAAPAEAVTKLIRMANQIAGAFAIESPEKAVAATAEHIRLYWTPKMRRDIEPCLEEGESRLGPIARDALAALRAKAGGS